MVLDLHVCVDGCRLLCRNPVVVGDDFYGHGLEFMLLGDDRLLLHVDPLVWYEFVYWIIVVIGIKFVWFVLLGIEKALMLKRNFWVNKIVLCHLLKIFVGIMILGQTGFLVG